MKLWLTMVTMTVSLWSLTMDEAIARALKTSPVLQQAKSDVRDAEYRVKEAGASFIPHLSAGFSWTDTEKVTAFGYTPFHRYNLSAKYNLFNGLKDYHTLKAEKLARRAAKLLYHAKVADVKLSVRSAYSRFLKAQKGVVTQEKALESLNRAYADTKVRFDQGVVAKNELLLIEVDRLSARQALVEAHSNLRLARSYLDRTMGGSLKPDDRLVEFVSKAEHEIEPYKRLLEATYSNRSELRALKLIKRSLDERYQASKSTYFPRVDIGADFIVNDREQNIPNIGVTQIRENTQVTVTASWNLYSGGAGEAHRLKALEQVNRQTSTIEAMKLDLAYQLTDAVEQREIAMSALKVATQAKKSAEENYRITKERHHYGRVDTLTYLKAQANLTAAHNSYFNAYYNLYTADATIARVTGE